MVKYFARDHDGQGWFDDMTEVVLVNWTKDNQRGIFRGVRKGLETEMECMASEFIALPDYSPTPDYELG